MTDMESTMTDRTKQEGGESLVSFSAKLTEQDLYRFNLYHTYTTSQGWISIFFGILIPVVAILVRDRLDTPIFILYFVVGIAMLVYFPLTLRIRSRAQLSSSEALQQEIDYRLTESGIFVHIGDESAQLPWDAVYKAVTARGELMIFSSRVNAYIIPLEQIADKYDRIRSVMLLHLPDHRVHMKDNPV